MNSKTYFDPKEYVNGFAEGGLNVVCGCLSVPNALVGCVPNALVGCVPNALVGCDPNALAGCDPNALVGCLFVPNVLVD